MSHTESSSSDSPRGISSLLSSRSFLRQLDLGTLELFVLCCEGGSIAHAAEKGQIAASALSKRIAELEHVVGVPLLERHARGVRPTFVGEQLVIHARGILDDVEHLRADLAEFSQGVHGRVQLCASASAVEQFLPADLAAFAQRNPEIRIELHQYSSRDVASAVFHREADLGICSPCAEVAPLQCKPYRTERLIMVMRDDHPLASFDELDYSQTLEHEQIGMRGSSTVQTLLNQAAREQRHSVRQRIEVDGLSAMCRMIECGMGIGVMPEGAFAALAREHLHAAHLRDAWALRALNIYALNFAQLSPAARRFVELLTGIQESPASTGGNP